MRESETVPTTHLTPLEETYRSDFLQHTTCLQASESRSLQDLMSLPHLVYEVTLQPESSRRCFCCLQTTSLETLKLGTWRQTSQGRCKAMQLQMRQ